MGEREKSMTQQIALSPRSEAIGADMQGLLQSFDSQLLPQQLCSQLN